MWAERLLVAWQYDSEWRFLPAASTAPPMPPGTRHAADPRVASDLSDRTDTGTDLLWFESVQ